MLSASQKDTVCSVMSLYCPILKRFFNDSAARNAACLRDIEFYPAPPCAVHIVSSVLGPLNNSIRHALGDIMPSRDFYRRREEVRCRLQNLICSNGVVPSTTELIVFGSSRNNFGSDSADLDMCLHYGAEGALPTGEERGGSALHVCWKTWHRPLPKHHQGNINLTCVLLTIGGVGLLIEKVGEVLRAGGMVDVQVRSTARIPIVLFTDPLSGLDCDISFNNPLAIRNTLLLASYSIIDVRVRELAYVIKHWAKRRHMNSPQEGTLSSYGYLLCLVHFLQTRSPPVVPNLQRLAPDWDPNMPPHIQAQLPLPKRWEKHPVEELYCNTYFYEASFQPEMHGPSSQSKLQVCN